MSDENRRTQTGLIEADEEREVAELLGLAGRRPEMPAADRALIEAAAHEEWQRLVKRQRERRRFASRSTALWLGAAAAALVAATIGLGLWKQTAPAPALRPVAVATVELARGESRQVEAKGAGRPLTRGGAIVAGDSVETGASATLALRLARGAGLRIDAGSRVRVISESRVALEKGALYVDSGGSDSHAPAITVETPFATLVEIGTQFEVRLADGSGPPLRLRVREGRVELLGDGRTAGASAGEELTLERDKSLRSATISRFGEAWSWVVAAAPAYEIEGRSLSTFLEWVERETGWTVRLEGAELADAAQTIRLHGSIAGLSPEQSVSVVLPGSGLDYRLGGGVLTVERPRPR